jgi:hypothetical protein
MCGFAASCAFDRTSFIVPAAPKASARKIWIAHITISALLNGVSEQLQFQPGGSAMSLIFRRLGVVGAASRSVGVTK